MRGEGGGALPPPLQVGWPVNFAHTNLRERKKDFILTGIIIFTRYHTAVPHVNPSQGPLFINTAVQLSYSMDPELSFRY